MSVLASETHILPVVASTGSLLGIHFFVIFTCDFFPRNFLARARTQAFKTQEYAGREKAEGYRLRFLSNVDPVDVRRTLYDLDPEETLVVVISKTFTTAETMLNARSVRRRSFFFIFFSLSWGMLFLFCFCLAARALCFV